jgi:signal transduction histidine kinase
MTVTDNGRGFAPDAPGPSSYGLSSMRERAEIIGGRLSLDSRPQDGTRVIVNLPVGVTSE